MQITYRRPRREDFTRLAEIYNHAVLETNATMDTVERSPDYYETFLGNSNSHRMLVAESDRDGVVAYAGTYPFKQRAAYDQCAEVMLYVHPKWQDQGIGSALLEKVHDDDFLKGLYTLIALINKENVHAHRTVERLGYTRKGEMTEAGFKFGKRQSIAIYQRHVALPSERNSGSSA